MAINAFKTGMVVITQALKHICRELNKYSPSIRASIDAAQTAGTITAVQAAQAVAFLGTVNAVCDVFRLITGY